MEPELKPPLPGELRFFLVNLLTGAQTDITEYMTAGFDMVADRGYIQVPVNEAEGEDLGPCCGYWCLNCPYMDEDEDEDVRSITDREEQNDY